MRAVRDLAIGVRAAFAVPGVIGSRLTPLLVRPVGAPRSGHPDAALAVRAAHGLLVRLARFGGPRWRNTCLYRSVAECLVLRELGLPAYVMIGVGAGVAPLDVIAHAWVECEGVRCVSTRGQAELETLATRATRTA
ncbi:MAG: lasso peptide biosynthesis B2 protein [Gemmatimonadaceae bacterium]